MNNFQVAKTTSDGFEFVVDVHIRGGIYWLPLADTTTPKIESQIVEIQKRDTMTNKTSVLSCDLAKLAETGKDNVSVFLGATGNYGFWTNETGYYVIDFRTAAVNIIKCEQRFLTYGEFDVVDGLNIKRTTREGIFILSIEGARDFKK